MQLAFKGAPAIRGVSTGRNAALVVVALTVAAVVVSSRVLPPSVYFIAGPYVIAIGALALVLAHALSDGTSAQIARGAVVSYLVLTIAGVIAALLGSAIFSGVDDSPPLALLGPPLLLAGVNLLLWPIAGRVLFGRDWAAAIATALLVAIALPGLFALGLGIVALAWRGPA